MAHRLQDYAPLGISKRTGENIKNVHSLFQGDDFFLDTVAFTRDGEVATSENSIVTFTLVDDRFRREFLFRATWADNLAPLNDVGGIRINIPEEVTSTFRRGKFVYSITVTDKLGKARKTVEEGAIQVEYGADAPDPDIPYRPEDSETQNDSP